MKNHWILVANASLARIFRRDAARTPLVPVETLSHEQSRMHGSELATDRSGQVAADNSHGIFEPRTDKRRKEHLRFAREIADRLDKGLAAQEFDSLTVFASSPFLGELKAQLSDAVEKKLKVALNNDFTSLGLAKLEERLQAIHPTIG